MNEQKLFPKTMICIVCPIGCSLTINKEKDSYTVEGNKCPRGKKYALEEMIFPKRIITSTVKIEGGLYPVIPVKTSKAIPKEKIFKVMEILSDIEIKSPVKIGDVIIPNVAETDADIIATKNS